MDLSAKIYVHQLCADTVFRLEDVASAMASMDGERMAKESMLFACSDDDVLEK